MRIVACQGARLHAPESSLAALIAAYTGGAHALQISVQLTRDGELVLAHAHTTEAMTGSPGAIDEMTLAELRQLDFSRTFKPRNSQNFRYFTRDARRLAVETLPAVLEALPEDVELLIQLRPAPAMSDARREELAQRTVEALHASGVVGRSVVCARQASMLRRVLALDAELRLAASALDLPAAEQLELLREAGADGLVTTFESLLANGDLTDLGRELAADHATGKLPLGAVVGVSRQPAVFTESEWRALEAHRLVWGVLTDSLFDVAFTRRRHLLVDETFAGTTVDRTRFALGYAKANSFAEVTQRDGIHVHIEPYPEIQAPPVEPTERRLQRIEDRLTNVAREWPYYSGGGLGHVPGIRGDFAAEVDYTAENATQATTLEMAVMNVDPGAHRGQPPQTFRDKDSFYDPHGAPPYVGVEHDEDDGYRINWNLGSEYDSNQYGRPVGDGKTARGARLRLERRGAFFSAYYKNEIDARDWVCVGVARNYSLNRVVYLRCVGKRWRQESEADPSVFLPIVRNHFVFKNLTIERF